MRRAKSVYLRQQFEAAPRLYVLVGHVELLEGDPIALAETYQMRREFVRAQRAQRIAADQARRANSDTVERPDTAERIEDMPLITTIKDVETDPAAGATEAARRRRHAKASTDVGVADLVDASDAADVVAGNDLKHTDQV